MVAGVRANNFPSEEEKRVIINFILRHYSDFTPAEIAFAFELAMARKLLELENPSCFENFSCEYVGRILSAYEKWDSSPKDYHSSALEGMRFQDDHDRGRSEVQAWYDRYLSGQHIDFIPGNICRTLILHGAIRQPGKLREYQKFLRVMRYFAALKEHGFLEVYSETSETNKLENHQ